MQLAGMVDRGPVYHRGASSAVDQRWAVTAGAGEGSPHRGATRDAQRLRRVSAGGCSRGGEHERVTDLLTRPLLRPAAAQPSARPLWQRALAGAAWAAGMGLVATVLVVVAGWATGGGAGRGIGLGDLLRAGAQAWLLAHGAPLQTAAGAVGLVPLGLTLVLVLLLHRAGRWAASASLGLDLREAAVAVGGAAVGYGLLAATVAALASTSVSRVSPAHALLAAVALAAVATGAGLWRGAKPAAALRQRLPVPAGAALAGAAGAVATLLCAGALLVTSALLAGADQTVALTHELQAGAAGAAGATLLGALLLPNAAVWAGAFALGPGFAVGVDTLVSPGGVGLGPVPGLPVLGALPGHVAAPLATAAFVVPLAAGVLAGLLVDRRLAAVRPSWRYAAGIGAAAGLLAAVGFAVLAGLSGGPVGAGRFAEVGPHPALVGLAVAVEVAPVAALTAGLRVWWPGTR